MALTVGVGAGIYKMWYDVRAWHEDQEREKAPWDRAQSEEMPG